MLSLVFWEPVVIPQRNKVWLAAFPPLSLQIFHLQVGGFLAFGVLGVLGVGAHDAGWVGSVDRLLRLPVRCPL